MAIGQRSGCIQGPGIGEVAILYWLHIQWVIERCGIIIDYQRLFKQYRQPEANKIAHQQFITSSPLLKRK
jgi:hypothetical protein